MLSRTRAKEDLRRNGGISVAKAAEYSKEVLR